MHMTLGGASNKGRCQQVYQNFPYVNDKQVYTQMLRDAEDAYRLYKSIQSKVLAKCRHSFLMQDKYT